MNSFQVPARDLIEGLTYLQRVIDAKHPVKILGYAHFPGDGTMRGTNLDQLAIWRLGTARGHTPFTINATAMQRVVKGADKGKFVEFEIEAVDDEPAARVHIQADGMKSRLNALPVADFPVPTEFGPLLNSFHMPEHEIRDLLRFCAPAISTEETRYYLNGIYLHPVKAKLAAVATDGHRLSLRTSEHDWLDEQPDRGVILPRAAVKVLLDTFSKKDNPCPVQMAIFQRGVEIQTPEWTLRTAVVDGTFPDYTCGIPRDATWTARIDVAKIDKAISRLIPLTSRGHRCAALDAAQNLLVIQDEDASVHKMPLGVVSDFGAGRVGFNLPYLRDVVKLFEGFDAKTIDFAVSDDGRGPVKITAPGVNGLHVLMPMRSEIPGHEAGQKPKEAA